MEFHLKFRCKKSRLTSPAYITDREGSSGSVQSGRSLQSLGRPTATGACVRRPREVLRPPGRVGGGGGGQGPRLRLHLPGAELGRTFIIFMAKVLFPNWPSVKMSIKDHSTYFIVLVLSSLATLSVHFNTQATQLPRDQHCTVKHHTDIINFACMTWNFVRISASLSALCTNFYLFDIGIAFLAKFYPILM